MKPTLLILAALAASSTAQAQYRCAENGKTVYSDRPCASTTPSTSASTKVIGDAANSAYSTTSGTWRGQVQFMAKSGNNVISEAHAVVPLVIDIDPQGKVTGRSEETGCVLKGISRHGFAPTITDLDVTLSQCRYAGFNRQMTGRIALYTEKRYTDFSLTAYAMQTRPIGIYEVKGTLRR